MKNKGFTLLEVLVSGLILFIALTTANTVFTSASKSAYIATQTLTLSAYSTIIRDDIKIAIVGQDKKRSGKGQFLGVNYFWNTTLEQSQSAVTAANEELSDTPTNVRTVNLWRVEMTLSKERKELQHIFYVTDWSL